MNKAKYEELFAAFGKAPMKEFLELLFEGIKKAAFLQNCRILAIFLPIFAFRKHDDKS